MFVLYIILGMLVAGWLFATLFYFRTTARMTSVATAEVVSSSERVIRDEKGRRDETVVVCRFSVHGKEYNVEVLLRGQRARHYPIGRPIPVRYNPADPTMSIVSIK